MCLLDDVCLFGSEIFGYVLNSFVVYHGSSASSMELREHCMECSLTR